MPRLLRALSLVALLTGVPAPAADLLHLDFHEGGDPAALAPLVFKGVQARIVAGGPEGRGHCLEIANPQPASECPLTLKGPIEIRKNLVLAFDYKNEVEAGFDGAYLGMTFLVDGKQWFWTSDEFFRAWRHAEISLPRLTGRDEHAMRPGLVLSGIQLYGRVKDTTRGQRSKARMRLWLANLRLYVGTMPPRVGDVVRLSYANPPLLDWPRPPAGAQQRLQYVQDPHFPAAGTHTVTLATNHYLPPAVFEPGKWYWRVWTEGELTADWSEAQAVVIPPEAHRFATAAVPVDDLARRPHPRLLPLARLGQAEVTPERRKQLVKEAQKIFRRGVPEHPGVHVPGDPRWPTWIDWYGKVAGNITGGTGRRLQFIAQYAMLTRDPQVIGWARDLALEACKWDPEGGSAMSPRRHRRAALAPRTELVLRRLLRRAFTAAADHVAKIIVQRARQFADRLLPFRGSEANNHAWLQGLALGEAGLVLCGHHDEAGDWAEYVRQLYIGRFLCCLGYQGDNNEGVSYWGYGLGFVIDYGDLMSTVCGIDIFRASLAEPDRPLPHVLRPAQRLGRVVCRHGHAQPRHPRPHGNRARARPWPCAPAIRMPCGMPGPTSRSTV